jgi:hypothetical protein
MEEPIARLETPTNLADIPPSGCHAGINLREGKAMTISKDEHARLAIILAMHAKPHKLTLHKGTNIIRNAIEDAKIIQRQAATIFLHCMNACNGIERYDAKLKQRIASWTPEDQDAADKAIERAGDRIMAVLADYKTGQHQMGAKCPLHIQRDPRGHVVRIAFKNECWSA